VSYRRWLISDDVCCRGLVGWGRSYHDYDGVWFVERWWVHVVEGLRSLQVEY
jgi:hypothetical protein